LNLEIFLRLFAEQRHREILLNVNLKLPASRAGLSLSLAINSCKCSCQIFRAFSSPTMHKS
jgi:hypothetical protein